MGGGHEAARFVAGSRRPASPPPSSKGISAVGALLLIASALPVVLPVVPPVTKPTPQQVVAAHNISRAFREKKLRYALLKAKCQSGKTGAYHSLINLMLATGRVERAYIVCGSSETILRDQAHDDAKAHNREFYDAGKIVIVFHQEFKDTVMDVTNAIVILDESHLVQTVGQGVHYFLGRHGITMDADPTNLVAKNTYVVSVDATPYSEEAALAHKQTPFEKHVETLVPGEGYRGLAEAYITGTLQPTYDITKNRACFEALLAKQGSKFALMRLANNNKGGNAAEAVVRTICAEKGYKVLLYTSDNTEVAVTRKEQAAILKEDKKAVPCLEDAPAVTTIVIIRGRLRAGKVVPKPHIGFVWEGAKSSKTDTIVQGLAGRMCGYHTETPDIFVPPSCLAGLDKKVLTFSEIERAIYERAPSSEEDEEAPVVVPRNASHLKKGAVATAPCDDKTACCPLQLVWDGTQLEDLKGNLTALKDEARQLFRRNLALLDASDRYTAEQKAEIRASVEGAAAPRGRLMDSTSAASALSYYKQVLEAHKNGTAPAELMDGCPTVTYVIAEPGFAGLTLPGANKKFVYAICYTKATGLADRSAVHHLSRIPLTDGKSIFSLNTSSFDKPVAAAGAVGIALEDIKVPAKLEARLREYIALQQTSGLVVSREITAEGGKGCFKLSKTLYHFVDKYDNDIERICTRLYIEFGLKKIDVKYGRSDGAKDFNVKSISW